MKYLKLLIINLVSFLILLLLLEFFLPTISLPIYTNRKINLVEHSPNQNKKFETSDGSKIIDFFTDKDGFLNYDKPEFIADLYQSLADYQEKIDDQEGFLKSLEQVRDIYIQIHGPSDKKVIKIKR